MRRIILSLIAAFMAGAAFAQDYATIRSYLTLASYDKAKEELDKAMNTPGFSGYPEAYILKASVYAALGMDKSKQKTAAGDKLTDEGDAAFRRYREMDPSLMLLREPAYQNGVMNLYSGYYASGYNDYALKNWNAAYGKMKKAMEYSDLLIEKRMVNITLDTNALILAGVAAENSGNTDDAGNYYGRLADAKITGAGFESVYRFMVSYCFKKKYMMLFERYRTTGAELYPQSEYFKYDKVDFAVGSENDYAAKMKALEGILNSDPDDFKANEVMGELIYDQLNPAGDSKPLPADTAGMEAKMLNAFNHAAAAKPGYENPFLYTGDHFINKAVKINDMLLKAGASKKTELSNAYLKALLAAQSPYEKAAAIYAARPVLSTADKSQYKKAAGYLESIAAYLKEKAASGSAERKKWETEESKWQGVINSL